MEGSLGGSNPHAKLICQTALCLGLGGESGLGDKKPVRTNAQSLNSRYEELDSRQN